MSLRSQVNDAEATYEDPLLGVNLHASGEDLQRGETDLMQNMVYFGGLVSRTGSTNLSVLLSSSFGITGGHMYYFGGVSPQKKRLVSYNRNLSVISDAGTETILYGLLTSNAKTTFTTWPITDRVYIADGSGPLLTYNGTVVTIAGGVNGGDTTYQWIGSLGGGTNEWYIRLNGGGNPNIADPDAGGVMINGTFAAEGSVGSLALGEWGYGNVDTLGYNTVYVRLLDSSDPNGKVSGYIMISQGSDIPGTNGVLPTAQVIGVVDRLFAITAAGIERTDPRDPSTWSNDSSWATFRPSQSGTFKAHIPHAVTSDSGSPVSGALALTENSYYFYTGTDFGDDVTNSTPSSGEDSAIYLIDNVGGWGPKSLASVPGVGTFWLTTNKDVFYVPTGQTRGRIIGTRIKNTGGGLTRGLESLRLTTADDAWMIYFEPYLMLGFAIDSDEFPTRQYWLDMNKFRLNPDLPIWYGPMVGQSVRSVWVEAQQGDNYLKGGEGNTAYGALVYNLRVTDTYRDAVGTTPTPLTMQVSTYLKSGGAPSREKYLQQVEIEMNNISGTAYCKVSDISGTILDNLPIEKTFLE